MNTPQMQSPADAIGAWTAGTMLQTTLLQRTEAMLRMQSGLFETVETISQMWLEHRQDDIRSALATVERMETAENTAERSTLWSDWMNERLKRWSGEASEMAERVQTMTHVLADAVPAADKPPTRLREAAPRRDRRSEGAA